MIPSVPLGKAGKFIRGITFKPDDIVSNRSEGSAVCMRTKNVQKDLDETDLISIPVRFVKRQEQHLKEGDILVSTANSWNLVGKCCWVPKLDYSATAGGFISILRANYEAVYPRYLYHWMSSPEIQYKLRYCGRQTTNISNMSYDLAEKILVPHPPLPEQKRIAAILDKADAVRRKRQLAIEKSEEFLRAVFLDMFGDPVINPKGWETKELENSLVDATNGISRRRKVFENIGQIVLRLQDVRDGRILLSDPNRIALNDKEKKKYKLQEGDITFIRVNGNKNYVGRSSVFGGNNEEIFFNDHIIRLRFDESYDPTFLMTFFNSPAGKREISTQIKTSAGQYTISQQGINKIKAILPPISLQKEYVDITKKCNYQKFTYHYYLKRSNELFNSLTQLAFRGELTNQATDELLKEAAAG